MAQVAGADATAAAEPLRDGSYELSEARRTSSGGGNDGGDGGGGGSGGGGGGGGGCGCGGE